MLVLSAAPALAGDVLNVPVPYCSIQEAINFAVDGDTVLVQPGTYHERIIFSGKAITVTSTNPDDEGVVATTIIDGDAAGRVVSFWKGEGADCVLTGFTIRNGNAPNGGGIGCWSCSPTITKNIVADNVATWADGGGILCTSASPTITKNVITGNSADWWGGGIGCNSGSTPTIADNTISNNAAVSGGGIGLYGGYSSPTVTGNIICGNLATYAGGGIRMMDSSPAVIGNVIESNDSANYGGAITISYDCFPEIRGNDIIGNCAADQGGGIYALAPSIPTIADNLISHNVSMGGAGWAVGGGIRCGRSAHMDITNNIIAYNEAAGGSKGDMGGGIWAGASGRIEGNQILGNVAADGGGVYCSRGPAVPGSQLINANTISGNAGDGVLCVGSASPTITANLISANALWGVRCWNTAATNAATLEADNTFGTNGNGWVLQCWSGLVRTVDASANPVAGAEVTILNNDGDTKADNGTPWTSGADGYAPDTADPASGGTWPLITEWMVNNGGKRKSFTPHYIMVELKPLYGGMYHSWNGPGQIVEVEMTETKVKKPKD
jgi:hypothetical protein